MSLSDDRTHNALQDFLLAIANLLEPMKIVFQNYHEIVPFTLAFMIDK